MRKLVLPLFVLFAFTYNLQAQVLIEEVMEVWSDPLDGLYSKITYGYDQNLNRSEMKVFLWSSAQNVWNEQNITYYTYNSSNQLIIERAGYNSFNNQWTDSYRKLYNYNSDGLLDNKLYQRWENNAWEDRNKYTYEYDGNENLLLYTVYGLSDSTWQYHYRESSLYNSEDLELYRFQFYWDTLMNDWEIDERRSYTYDDTLKIIEQRDGLSNGTWGAAARTLYAYDNEGKLRIQKLQYWYNFTGEWRTVDIIEYNYNMDGSVHELLEYSVYENGNTDLVTRITYYYGQPQGVEDLSVSHLNLYPNPANDVVNISLKETLPSVLTIFTVEGKVVSTQTLMGRTNEVSIGDLPSGFYFVQVQQQGRVYSGSLVKR